MGGMHGPTSVGYARHAVLSGRVECTVPQTYALPAMRSCVDRWNARSHKCWLCPPCVPEWTGGMYGLTNVHSARHAVLCGPVECTVPQTFALPAMCSCVDGWNAQSHKCWFCPPCGPVWMGGIHGLTSVGYARLVFLCGRVECTVPQTFALPAMRSCVDGLTSVGSARHVVLCGRVECTVS